MRVLFLSEGLDRPETHLLIGLRQAGCTVSAILPPGEPAHAALEKAGVVLHPLPFRSRVDLRAIRAIRRLVAEGNVQIAHALRNNRPVSNLLLATCGLPVRRVAYRGTMGNLSRWNPGSHMTYLSRRLDRIVCVSNAVMASLRDAGVPLSRLVTIYKGHDPAWYDATPAVDLQRTFGIPPGEIVVGCAANMRPLKGVHVLLEALRHLPPQPRLHLLLVGRVEDERLHDLARENRTPHQIHLPGFRPDAAGILKSCQIFVMPSLRREGLPRAAIEAMCAGVPPIVTNVGGLQELVEHRLSGRIVPAGSARELARSISLFAGDATLRQQCGRQARRRIEEKFSLARTLTATRALYESLLKES
jgi:glycosyltransferase involved in cell wall biosynthesis